MTVSAASISFPSLLPRSEGPEPTRAQRERFRVRARRREWLMASSLHSIVEVLEVAEGMYREGSAPGPLEHRGLDLFVLFE
eukprot:7391608-Prymnesium_polylepis.1